MKTTGHKDRLDGWTGVGRIVTTLAYGAFWLSIGLIHAQPLPPAAQALPTKTNLTYIAATSYDVTGLESAGFSNEVIATNASMVNLAWDRVTNAAGYNLYYGTNSRSYQHMVNAGSNTTFTLVVVPAQTNIWKIQPIFSTNLTNWAAVGQSWSFTNTMLTNQSGFWRLQVQQQ